MIVSRGDVVIALFPHASGSGSKPRPVPVVQSDVYNTKLQNLIVAAITTNLKHAADPASVSIDVATPEGKQSGLTQNSIVTCVNLATIDGSLAAKRIGRLPPALMQRVDASLKAALALP
ncbi:MAG: type II toxin-antitoxin system PemK/MazF family toxin [Zavarzinella sp.]|nr:type II toxin-antitoxin system PemK/MazF family toxin [Zavarzinella sp.]